MLMKSNWISVLYASGRSGWAYQMTGPRENLHPLLDLINEKMNPAPLDKTNLLQCYPPCFMQIVF